MQTESRNPKIIPCESAPSGWYETARNRRRSTPLQNDIRVDWAIVGAGFTGLSFAGEMANIDPDTSIAIFDALPLGWGASGRNSGFVVDAIPPEGGLKGVSKQRAIQKSRLLRAGTKLLRDKVRTFAIDCAWAEQPRLIAGSNPFGEERVRALADGFRQVDRDVDILDPQTLQARLGTEFYTSGLAVHGGATMQPVELQAGLADNLPNNVQIFDNTAVTGLSGIAPYRLSTPTGTVTAQRVALCCNVHLPQFGFGAGRYMYLATYASLSQPLNSNQLAALGTDEHFALTPSVLGASTLRRTHDDRLLIRRSTTYAPSLTTRTANLGQLASEHKRALVSRWPQLCDLSLAHTWGGVVSYPANHGQIFGELRKGLYASASCFGVGVSLGAISGKLLAQRAAGIHSPEHEDVDAIPFPTRLPPEPIRRIIAINAIRKNVRASQPD